MALGWEGLEVCAPCKQKPPATRPRAEIRQPQRATGQTLTSSYTRKMRRPAQFPWRRGPSMVTPPTPTPTPLVWLRSCSTYLVGGIRPRACVSRACALAWWGTAPLELVWRCCDVRQHPRDRSTRRNVARATIASPCRSVVVSCSCSCVLCRSSEILSELFRGMS